jgi:hypothetical protein
MPSVRATRGRRRRTVGAAAALALAACLVSACGDDSNTGLSQERGADLRASLDRVEGDVSSGDCTGAAQQAGEFRRQVASLPARVDRDLRVALERSATRLESLVSKECEPQPAAPVDEAPVEEQPPADENAGDQQGKDKKDKKPKKPKGTTGQEGSTGTTGQEGSTGVTGQEGTTFPPEGG